ncbi:phage/plasmid replication protein [Plesiomonas shigelloides]|uniref:phage/plasmid replication domain-containing protein n=1 Tax=Plesiomonas shigelloides TaxID=703 RepID=UPI002248505D|nr:phage/plasmid replication protein [Plesiomonas shigelloides]MCX2534990.1 phage/plasmid replication protein [Plesiomonas shigelloides]
MFFDWLTIEQDFMVQLPLIGETGYQRLHIDQSTGEQTASSMISQPKFQHRGSFCDSVSIHIRGSVLRMSGNPSRWGRLDNLFGYDTVDKCVSVYNQILTELGLPNFTKVTKIWPSQLDDKTIRWVCNGATIKELHITTNLAVGEGNEDSYISALSTLPYRNSKPRLHTDGKSVDWLSKQGNANLIYPTVYNKSYELSLHAMPKILRTFGESSPEYAYLKQVFDYCQQSGIVRFEQKLKSRYLQKHDLHFWGYSDLSKLKDLQIQFTELDKKLTVTAMDFETISSKLISEGVVDTVRAANTTTLYALEWMHGKSFDFKKRQVQQHRARLRQIGIDIAQPCNISKFSPVFVRNAREIVVADAVIPSWYQRPVTHLRAA